MSTQDFYVYALFREDGRTPFYIGKGRKERWTEHERWAKRGRSYKDNLICQMKDRGIPLKKRKLDVNLSNDQACELEMFLIAEIGRHPNGPLTNQTRGGEGVVELSPEAKERHRRNTTKAMQEFVGKPFSKERCEKISKAQIGKKKRPHSEAWRSRMSRITEAAWKDPEIRAKRTGMLGRKHSEATKAKMRDAAIRRQALKPIEEKREHARRSLLAWQKIHGSARGMLGKKMPEEGKEKIRAAMKRHWEKKRG